MSSARTRPCEEEIIQSTSLAENRPADAKPWVLLASILASSVAYIDESIVNVALPAIETDLATSAIVVQWLVNAYTLCLSALLLVGGAAGDQFGTGPRADRLATLGFVEIRPNQCKRTGKYRAAPTP